MWDPFEVLWLPHDPGLPGWRVLSAYPRRVNDMYRVTPDQSQWPTQTQRLRRAAGALRTRSQRRAVLADLAVQPGFLHGLGHERPGWRWRMRC